MGKRILIIGATGAMGSYLTEEMINEGYEVYGVTRTEHVSTVPNLHYIQAPFDAKDPEFVRSLSEMHYDAIVDFMIYDSISFRKTFPKYLDCTDQYVYLSSCRVYANEENPIRENSPQLLDVTTDRALLFSDDYCIHKARGEDALKACGRKNWTIIRPSTTYSRKRCQLLTLERNKILKHIRSGEPVLLYEAAQNVPASLTWGGDVAKMIKGLLFREDALTEDFNVTSSESRTWSEIANYYHDIFGLNYEWVDEVSYQKFRDPDFDPEKSLAAIWQLRYARMFNRSYDNSKILNFTGLKQQDFLTLYQGLSHEKKTILED